MRSPPRALAKEEEEEEEEARRQREGARPAEEGGLSRLSGVAEEGRRARPRPDLFPQREKRLRHGRQQEGGGVRGRVCTRMALMP